MIPTARADPDRSLGHSPASDRMPARAVRSSGEHGARESASPNGSEGGVWALVYGPHTGSGPRRGIIGTAGDRPALTSRLRVPSVSSDSLQKNEKAGRNVLVVPDQPPGAYCTPLRVGRLA